MSHIDKQHAVKQEMGSHATVNHAKHKYIIHIYTQSKQKYNGTTTKHVKGTISKSKLSNVSPIIKYTKKNTKIGIYQSANQKPHFPQFVFELDPYNPQWSRHFVDPRFSITCVPTRWARLAFFVGWKTI